MVIGSMDEITSLFDEADPFKSWWPAIAAAVVGIIIAVRAIMSGQRCPNDNQIRDQIVIVTGANTGIGFEIAKALAGRGGHVILACRNMEAAEKAAAIIKRELSCQVLKDTQKAAATNDGTKDPPSSSSSSVNNDTGATNGNGNDADTDGGNMFFVEARYLDLRSFDNVQRFARKIMAEFERIDILINNAGIIFDPVKTNTTDGFEQHLQVNYMAPFLLSHLLLPHLKKSPNGRIINVSAHSHVSAKMDFDDPLNVGTWATKFHARDAFSHSKLAVLLATRWMAKELKDTSITVNCCTPGLVRGTSHLRSSPLMSAFCVRVMTYPWMWMFMKNPSQGAQSAIRLATDPKLKHVTGEYFNDCEIAVSSPLGQDKELAKKLYQQTMRILKIATKLEIDKGEEKENEIRIASAEESKAATAATSATPTPPPPSSSSASSTSADTSNIQQRW
ncbi:retinol dehydrogenase 13 isoform X1 [Musca domestica]|uniref:Retinol dehydrogenase 13 isoform X1 n=2 Tax=Musca domestica TaxID=7370 RepID=A0ABM3VQT4_MUSDO|nr:retinol dehydrogenase 13 isoform X1 [Musca domestica]